MKAFCLVYNNTLTALCEKCPYSELFWSTFSRIQTEYGEILRISLNSVQMRENADQNNSEYENFLCGAGHWICNLIFINLFVKSRITLCNADVTRYM